MLQLAHATIGLSKVAPRLNELAGARQQEAERQAERATEVTSLTRQMSESLAETVGTLRTATSEIADLAVLIRRIAEQTSLIAINTGVAAAHAIAPGGGADFQRGVMVPRRGGVAATAQTRSSAAVPPVAPSP